MSCAYCGAAMERRRKNARYCSGTCRARAAEQRRRAQSSAPDSRPFWREMRDVKRSRPRREAA